MRRSATLIVVDQAGMPLGAFGPIIASRHLPEANDLIDAAFAAGLDLTILRIQKASEPSSNEVIDCTYVAEAHGSVPPGLLSPLPEHFALDEHPLRLAYARPGGVAQDLAWADAVLSQRGRRRIGRPRQERTWNLSCVHRLTLDDGSTAWLKVVPPFFAHEGAMLAFMRRTAPELNVPTLLASDRVRGRVLLGHVDGPLMWGAPMSRWSGVIDAYVATQVALSTRVGELLSLGAPDWRNDRFRAAATHLAQRTDVRNTLAPQALRLLDELIDSLPATLDALAACGLPATLVHGDLHQGNVLDSPQGPVALDWGDAGVGHPLFDLPALCHRLPDAQHAAVAERVVAAWQSALPASNPARAARLIGPLTALRQALVYRNFLDHIEPSEHHYHDSDVPYWLTEALRRAAALST